MKEIDDCQNVNSVNPLNLMINKMIGQFKEKSGNKYLVLHDVNKNKEAIKEKSRERYKNLSQEKTKQN